VATALEREVAVTVDERGNDRRAARVDDLRAGQIRGVIRADPGDAAVRNAEADTRAQGRRCAVGEGSVVEDDARQRTTRP
jgi:hypothetical protein